MEYIRLKELKERKEQALLAGKVVFLRDPIRLHVEAYNNEGAPVGIACGCGGSGFMCRPCMKLWLHEIEAHGTDVNNGVIIVDIVPEDYAELKQI